MGKVRNKVIRSDWKEYTLTEAEQNFVKTVINTRDVVNKSYDELVGRFLGAAVGPRVGQSEPMQYELDPDDKSRKVKMRPTPEDKPET